MQFRLTYEGPLKGSAGRNNHVENKHHIRRAFHPQLRQLWTIHPFLKNWPGEKEIRSKRPEDRQLMKDELADSFRRNGHRFVPLVTRGWDLTCALHILFLRPGFAGDIVHGGDVDGRLKTLFDALRMPSNSSELGKEGNATEDEDPFFCLLEDDALITQVSVETDILLAPVSAIPTIHDSRLVITVSLGPGNVTLNNIGFGGR